MNKPIAWINEYQEIESFNPDNRQDWIPLYTHSVKEFNDGGEPVKNATYWKRQYNLMASQNDNLKSGLYHANEQIKYLEGQLDTRTKELIGASFYEHDYKTMMANNEPVAWWTGEFNDEADDFMFDKTKQNHMNHVNSRTHEFFPIPLYTHPVKELTDELLMELYEMADYSPESYLEFARAILRKAQEK